MKTEQTYECPALARGIFRHNDHVCMEMSFAPIEQRTGRLVQVRVGRGQYGSDIFIIRLRDGSSMRWENALMRKVGDARFEDGFYRSNGREPPAIPDQPIDPKDTLDAEWTLNGEYPETGFVIEKPSQPRSHSPDFSICIMASGRN